MKTNLPHSVVALVVFATALGFATVPARAAGPFEYFPITPCRVFDTRTTGPQTNGMPLTNPGPYNFTIQGNCGVPIGAKAVTLNATVVSPSRPGDLRLYPAGGTACKRFHPELHDQRNLGERRHRAACHRHS